MPLVAIVGPTASGKSAVGVDVALKLKSLGVEAEIVSADAMQLYRGMDIGTAKITLDEARGVVHHLCDVWDTDREASVQDYQRRAREVITDCLERGVMPILVGGSGLYVSAVLYQFDFPGTHEQLRSSLEDLYSREGIDPLVSRLIELDPDAEQSVDLKNPRRVIRAIEILELTGTPQTPGLKARDTLWHGPTIIFGIEWPRETLVRRIDERVERMWEAGLVDEVRHLSQSPPGLGKTAAQAIGYREVLEYLAEARDEKATREAIAQHTRRYARKQMSWFRRDTNIQWIEPAHTDAVEHIVSYLQQMSSAVPRA